MGLIHAERLHVDSSRLYHTKEQAKVLFLDKLDFIKLSWTLIISLIWTKYMLILNNKLRCYLLG